MQDFDYSSSWVILNRNIALVDSLFCLKTDFITAFSLWDTSNQSPAKPFLNLL